MIFRVTLSDEDGIYNSLHDSALECVAQAHRTPADELDVDESEIADAIDMKHEKMSTALDKWAKNEQTIVLEVDTDAKTCRVVPVSELT